MTQSIEKLIVIKESLLIKLQFASPDNIISILDEIQEKSFSGEIIWDEARDFTRFYNKNLVNYLSEYTYNDYLKTLGK